jgi:predicted DNA-binding ribbon-helix-helix protein
MTSTGRTSAVAVKLLWLEPGRSRAARKSVRVSWQMPSLRLEPQLLQELREFAEQRGLSVSDVLRQAAVDLLGRASQAHVVVSIAQVETQQAIRGISVQSIPTGTGSMARDPAPRVA